MEIQKWELVFKAGMEFQNLGYYVILNVILMFLTSSKTFSTIHIISRSPVNHDLNIAKLVDPVSEIKSRPRTKNKDAREGEKEVSKKSAEQ